MPKMSEDEYKQMTRAELQDYFEYFDTDFSGELEREEMIKLGENIGMNVRGIDKLMEKIDTNGDGKIQFEEFYT